jgi:sugar O-acyltransferase (sialic acid O-acetyltransferase NeuD family)
VKARARLVIVGGGGFGREMLWTANDVPADRRDWDVAGFVDDDVDGTRAQLARLGFDVPVLGSVADYQPADGDRLTCAIGAPRTKLRVCEELRGRGGRFADVIHPSAVMHASATTGEGLILRHFSGISVNCTVGDFVTINSSSGLGHDAVVADGCTLSAHADVMGGARLERGAMVGSHAAVLPGATVGEFATVGAGTVVLRRVKAETTVFGVPAREV